MREKLSSELKIAMKSGLKRRVETIRLVNAALKNSDIEARATGKTVGEGEIVTLLRKMVKSRQESEAIYSKAGRVDLATRENEEIAIISEFMPRQMDDNEVLKATDRAIIEVGATSPKDLGRVISALKSQHAGNLDFSKASAYAKERLAKL